MQPKDQAKKMVSGWSPYDVLLWQPKCVCDVLTRCRWSVIDTTNNVLVQVFSSLISNNVHSTVYTNCRYPKVDKNQTITRWRKPVIEVVRKNVCKKLDWQGTLVSNSGRTSIALVLLGSICSSTQDSELMALYSLVAQKSCVCSLQRCLLDSAAAQPSQLQNIIWKCKFENWLKLEIYSSDCWFQWWSRTCDSMFAVVAGSCRQWLGGFIWRQSPLPP